MATAVDQRAMAPMLGPWWLFLITGIAWLCVAKIVLDADLNTVAAIAVMAGFLFIVAGVNEFVVAGAVASWRWLHVLVGILFVVVGILAFVRPGTTFLSLAAIIGWFLIFKGPWTSWCLSPAARSKTRHRRASPWLLGGGESPAVRCAPSHLGWAAGLARGLMEIILAFRLRDFQKAMG